MPQFRVVLVLVMFEETAQEAESKDSEAEIIPDLITQTDRFGNSLAPRSEGNERKPATSEHKSGGYGPLSLIFYKVCCCFTLEPPRAPLLPPQNARSRGKKCLILDLDETLVHSAFVRLESPDYTLSVKLDPTKSSGKEFKVFVLKRPGLHDFLLSGKSLRHWPNVSNI